MRVIKLALADISYVFKKLTESFSFGIDKEFSTAYVYLPVLENSKQSQKFTPIFHLACDCCITDVFNDFSMKRNLCMEKTSNKKHAWSERLSFTVADVT